jgi:hypothetical protein
MGVKGFLITGKLQPKEKQYDLLRLSCDAPAWIAGVQLQGHKHHS